MPKKRTYPKSAEAFNAFIRKHGLEDLSKLEERLEVGKGYLRYYVSKGTARLRNKHVSAQRSCRYFRH